MLDIYPIYIEIIIILLIFPIYWYFQKYHDIFHPCLCPCVMFVMLVSVERVSVDVVVCAYVCGRLWMGVFDCAVCVSLHVCACMCECKRVWESVQVFMQLEILGQYYLRLIILPGTNSLSTIPLYTNAWTSTPTPGQYPRDNPSGQCPICNIPISQKKTVQFILFSNAV